MPTEGYGLSDIAAWLKRVISGNEIQVDIVSSALPAGGTTEATLVTIQTALEILNNIVAGNEAQVDVVTMPQVDVGAATPIVTSATGTGAIATSYVPTAAFWLKSITLHLSSAGTTAEDFTVTLNANDGAVYDTVLLSQDLSSPATTDVDWAPTDGPRLYESGDVIDVAWPNSENRTYGLRISTRLA